MPPQCVQIQCEIFLRNNFQIYSRLITNCSIGGGELAGMVIGIFHSLYKKHCSNACQSRLILVSCHSSSVGSRHFSLIRASSDVNYQPTFASNPSLCDCHAATSRLMMTVASILRFRHSRAMTRISTSATLSQLPSIDMVSQLNFTSPQKFKRSSGALFRVAQGEVV